MTAPGFSTFAIVVFLCAGLMPCSGNTATIVSGVDTPPATARVIVDARAATKCEKASLLNARCLPAGLFFDDRGKLANFSGVLWMFGAVGLNGDEHVLVVGASESERNVIAGLLYIAGQRKISVLQKLPNGMRDPGAARSQTRERVFKANTRANAIVFKTELMAASRSQDAGKVYDLDVKHDEPAKSVFGKVVFRSTDPRRALVAFTNRLMEGKPAVLLMQAGAATPRTSAGHDPFSLVIFFALSSSVLVILGWGFFRLTRSREISS